MKVGIYNRHLMGIGGGEKHMLAMAEILSRHYAVEVLTHRLLDLNQAGANLGLDMRRVHLRLLPDRPDPALAPVTAEYDLFINASDGTFMPSQARRSLLLVYFPTPLCNTPWVRLKWHMGHWLRRFFSMPEWVEGFYGPEKWGNHTVRRLAPTAVVQLPTWPGARSLSVRMTLLAEEAATPVSFWVNGTQVATCMVPGNELTPVIVPVPITGSGMAQLQIVSPARRCGSSAVVSNLAVVDLHGETAGYPVYRFLFQRWLRELGQRLDALYPALHLDHLNTYDLLCANSEYTRRWIRQYWQRESVVFYPPVDVEQIEPRPKRRQILSVGRFFTTGHNKKHLVMIRAFREMLAEGLTGWELHLAGGTALGAMNADYLARVRAAAVGAPIWIHTDISVDTLRDLYSRSAIYWHAAGYGEDPQRHPLRYEHFGLTTVEAMAAGAVPVVIDGGGQPEIVTHGVDGFLWQTLDQLKAFTSRLVENPELCQQMGRTARRRSQAFGMTIFERRLWQIIKEVQG